MKFRKKPALIEAVRFDGFGGNTDAVVTPWPGHWYGPPHNGPATWTRDGRDLIIHTAEGTAMRASPGYWIIRGANGEFYPCKPDTFAVTYEPDSTPAHMDECLGSEADRAWSRAAELEAELARLRASAPAPVESAPPGLLAEARASVALDGETHCVDAVESAPGAVAKVIEAAREVDLWQDKLIAPGGLNPPGYCPPLERLRAALREMDRAPSSPPAEPLATCQEMRVKRTYHDGFGVHQEKGPCGMPLPCIEHPAPPAEPPAPAAEPETEDDHG